MSKKTAFQLENYVGKYFLITDCDRTDMFWLYHVYESDHRCIYCRGYIVNYSYEYFENSSDAMLSQSNFKISQNSESLPFDLVLDEMGDYLVISERKYNQIIKRLKHIIKLVNCYYGTTINIDWDRYGDGK